MRYAWLWVLLLSACRSPGGPEVQVTLDDGQRLVGRLNTQRIALATQMGVLEFDTAVAGELGLVEGPQADASGQVIRLWLRNGSEFVGRWERPAVVVEIALGEAWRAVDVPIAKLQRMQFRGDPIDPRGEVFRVVTRAGDDFFVDLTRTRLAFVSDLGRFEPLLADIASLQPEGGEGRRWRVALRTGTVLKGTIEARELDLRLAVGPERVVVPLDQVAHMDRQVLDVPLRQVAAAQSVGFFTNAPQKEAKERAATQWQSAR